MKSYLDIVSKVLNEGKVKKPVRQNPNTKLWEPVDGGVKTYACPNILFSHDMADGFPLLTTKKVAWKVLCVELEGFIRGITSKGWFKDRGCNIWNEWCNPKRLQEVAGDAIISNEERKAIQLDQDDLGPVYGFQWRRFNACYDSDDNGWIQEGKSKLDQQVADDADQLKNIVNTLRQNPMDRRMVCSAWNPLQTNRMALPPCHWGWNVTVIEDELSLFWAQRSCDLMLGAPFDIASYGLLLSLLAHDAGLKPGNLSGMFVDCHIYENQIEGAKEQITREPRCLPELHLPKKDIFDWTYEDVELDAYYPHGPIKFGAIAV